MSIKRDIFQGLSAFPITPADPDGTVDTSALVRILERLDIPGVHSIGLLGSTGNYLYLTREQRKRAIHAAVQALQGRKPLIVSAGALRTDEAQHLAKDAEEAGVNGLLLAPVSYTPLTEEEVYTHFETVAGSTTLPICIYNTPSTTHFTFSDALLARIAALPNVVALKQPAPTAEPKARHEELRAKLPPGFSIGYSADWLVAEPLLAGGDAWYSAIAGVLPAPSVALMDSIRRGDHVEVRRISTVLQPIWDLFQEFGDMRVIFALANELGLCKTAPPRPILPIDASHHGRIRAALASVQELSIYSARFASNALKNEALAILISAQLCLARIPCESLSLISNTFPVPQLLKLSISDRGRHRTAAAAAAMALLPVVLPAVSNWHPWTTGKGCAAVHHS